MKNYYELKAQKRCTDCGKQDERTLRGLTKCKRCSDRDKQKYIKNHIAKPKKPKAKKPIPLNLQQTLCWTCKHSVPKGEKGKWVRGCSWAIRRVPVIGWNAVRNDKVGCSKPSYLVRQCPLYEKG